MCTVNELLSISQRYEVAKMLREGQTYLDISNATGAVRKILIEKLIDSLPDLDKHDSE